MPGRDSLSMKASYKMKNIQAIVNGKKYITSKLNTTDGKKVDYYRLTDWETGDVLDSIATLGVWFTDKIGDYTVHYQSNSPMCTSYGDKLAIAYAHTGRVDFYDLKDDKFALYKSQGDLRTIEQLHDDMPKLKDNAEGSVEEVASDKNYVYVLERTKIKEDANGLPTYKCIVKVYGWGWKLYGDVRTGQTGYKYDTAPRQRQIILLRQRAGLRTGVRLHPERTLKITGHGGSLTAPPCFCFIRIALKINHHKSKNYGHFETSFS